MAHTLPSQWIVAPSFSMFAVFALHKKNSILMRAFVLSCKLEKRFHHLSGIEGPKTSMVGATLAVALAPAGWWNQRRQYHVRTFRAYR